MRPCLALLALALPPRLRRALVAPPAAAQLGCAWEARPSLGRATGGAPTWLALELVAVGLVVGALRRRAAQPPAGCVALGRPGAALAGAAVALVSPCSWEAPGRPSRPPYLPTVLGLALELVAVGLHLVVQLAHSRPALTAAPALHAAVLPGGAGPGPARPPDRGGSGRPPPARTRAAARPLEAPDAPAVFQAGRRLGGPARPLCPTGAALVGLVACEVPLPLTAPPAL